MASLESVMFPTTFKVPIEFPGAMVPPVAVMPLTVAKLPEPDNIPPDMLRPSAANWPLSCRAPLLKLDVPSVAKVAPFSTVSCAPGLVIKTRSTIWFCVTEVSPLPIVTSKKLLSVAEAPAAEFWGTTPPLQCCGSAQFPVPRDVVALSGLFVCIQSKLVAVAVHNAMLP